MSDLAVNVTWQEILRETEAGDIPHCRAIAVKSACNHEIIETYARLTLGSYRETHPDLLVIGSPSKAPYIDVNTNEKDYNNTCRGLIDNIALKPLEATRRLGVIQCADKLLLPAANSLLKLAEEPPGHAVLLFLMEDGRLFLPTLKSRSRFNTITIAEREESRRMPQTDSEWLSWLAETRKSKTGPDKAAGDLRAWSNYEAGAKNYVKAAKLEQLRILAEGAAERKSLSLAMLCDVIILTLKEGLTWKEDKPEYRPPDD